jgi:hypothetical protein
MESSEFLNKKTEFVNNLTKSLEEIAQLEKLTVQQSSNQIWKTTNRNKAVHNMLFSTFIGNWCTEYGIEKERIALEEFQEKHDKCLLDPCSLFVDEVDPYIGASPDSVIRNKNAIIELKCHTYQQI